MKQVFLRLTMMMLAAVPMTGVGQQVAVLQQDGLIQTADSVVLDSITGTAHIKFPVSLADIIEGYSNNAVELGRISKELWSSCCLLILHTIHIPLVCRLPVQQV